MVRIGIIGAGSIVESCHIPALKSLPRVEIAWIYDQDENRSKLLAEMYSIKKVIPKGKWEEALPEMDVCLLAIPYGARKSYLDTMASEQKALYVEKPFATRESEHRQLCDLFPEFRLAIGFQRRFYQTVWTLQSIMENRVFGELKKIDYTQGTFTIKGGQGYHSNMALAGGGVLIESAIHAFDQIFCFTGTKSFQLNSKKVFQSDGIDYDTVLDATLEMKNGKSCMLHSEVSSLQNLDNGLTLTFDTATLQCQLTPNDLMKVKTHSGETYILNRYPQNPLYASSINESFFLFWTHFLNSMEEKKPNLTSASSSILTTDFIEKIYER